MIYGFRVRIRPTRFSLFLVRPRRMAARIFWNGPVFGVWARPAMHGFLWQRVPVVPVNF